MLNETVQKNVPKIVFNVQSVMKSEQKVNGVSLFHSLELSQLLRLLTATDC